MSGIAGIIHFDGKPIEPGLIEKMTSAMSHRGPDGIHHWVNGSTALGQCMFRTTPESLEEHQPLTNEDESLVLVMDGRVDNWEDLRKDLLGRGALLRNRSDAELVLRSFEIWGSECADRIIGEFVCFIWDARQRQLFGARDAAGTRHFYYYKSNGWFAFASEIKGLLALDAVEPQLNESRLLDYLVVEFDRDDEIGTFYQDINRLPAGNAMCVSEVGLNVWRYWNPGDLRENSFSSLDECTEGFLEQLRIAVKCRLRSIYPIGSMLSGGLDSSSIVGLISKEFPNDLIQPLQTYSLIRHDRGNCPDWLSIEKILKANNWIKPTIITSAIGSNICRKFLDQIPIIDEPFGLSHGLNNFIVYEVARENGSRVVLDGIAGDLLFYGDNATLTSICRRKNYQQILAWLVAHRQHRSNYGIKYATLKIIRTFLASVSPKSMRDVYRKLRVKRPVSQDDLQLLHREVARCLLTNKYKQRYQEAGYSVTSNDQVTHARYFTSGLLSFAHEVYGQLALSSGVEPRSPFSDRRMIEYAIQMPIDAKLSLGWYKHVLRKCMNGILPEEVRWRQNNAGHPGWKFYEHLASEMAHHSPEIWHFENVNSILDKWIDNSSLSRKWYEYTKSADYSAGSNLYTLTILARWLSLQPGSMQPK